jgi:CubicO group peptidase (beta-lactamase class C family)
MSRFSLCIIALLAAAPPASSAARPSSGQRIDLSAAVDSIIDAQVAADAFSGVVLFTDSSGRTYRRAGGVANRQNGVRMEVDTKLQIASITKLCTQIAIRQIRRSGPAHR